MRLVASCRARIAKLKLVFPAVYNKCSAIGYALVPEEGDAVNTRQHARL